MSKIAIVDKCDICPHFDDVYWTNSEVCEKLGRRIEENMAAGCFHIPDDCPLPDWEASIGALIERLEKLKGE